MHVRKGFTQNGELGYSDKMKIPDQKIFATKINFKSACWWCHLNAKTPLQTCTHLPEDELVIISLRLSFGGRPCPKEWGVLAEPICDLTNTLLKTDSWDLDLLLSPYQQLVPPKQLLHDNLSFGEAKELVVEIPIYPRGQADVYIDDFFALPVNISGTDNTKHLESAPY